MAAVTRMVVIRSSPVESHSHQTGGILYGNNDGSTDDESRPSLRIRWAVYDRCRRWMHSRQRRLLVQYLFQILPSLSKHNLVMCPIAAEIVQHIPSGMSSMLPLQEQSHATKWEGNLNRDGHIKAPRNPGFRRSVGEAQHC